MTSCQTRGKQLLAMRTRNKPQSSSYLSPSQARRNRSSSLGAEVSMRIDCVSMEETDNGGSVSASPSPGESRKGSIESSGEVVAPEIAEQKPDSEKDTPVCDKETREEGGNSSSDGVTETEQLRQQLANCKRQIEVLSEEAKESEQGRLVLERTVDQLRQKLDEASTTRSKGKLKRWQRRQGTLTDLHRQTSHDDVVEDPLEVMLTFIESERLYLNNLTVLDSRYQHPMRTLSAFKPDVLPLKQLESLFLNCSELLNLHRLFYEELSQILSLPENIQLEQFFSVLEKIFPSFSLYNSFTDSTRQMNLQKELRALQQKPEFAQLLQHCQTNCGGKDLKELLTLPSERLSEYTTLLTRFHASSVRGLTEEATKRAGDLINFLKNLRYELLDEKSEWDYTLEKIKLLQKLVPDRPIPMEIFDSDVHLVKQGPLTQVVSGKELPRFCFLFSKYIALAERITDTQYAVLEHGMIPLSGAQLHKCVDVEGQVIAPDLQSGLKEDLLAFRLSFVNNESLFFRAAKPNQRNAWIEMLEKCIQDCYCTESDESLYPDVGPKIAAASMEKLFQQLTTPRKFGDDFMDIFLMTHGCFTSSREVLTALLNCIKSPTERQPDSISQESGSAVFSFDYPELDQPSSCVSTSTSYMDITSESEQGSPIPSPAIVRRTPSNPSPSSTFIRQTANRKLQFPNAQSSVRTSLSTSDSDSSPHTSAVVVDNPLGRDTTKNGWTDPEMSLRIVTKEIDKPEDPDYVKFYPSHNGNQGGWEDNDHSDMDEDGPTPRPSLTANDMIAAASKKRQKTYSHSEVLSEINELGEYANNLLASCEDKEVLKGKILEMSPHSLKMNAEELGEAFQNMQDVIDALDLPLSPPIMEEDDTFDETEDQLDMEAGKEIHRRKSRSLSDRGLRHSTVFSSEPDLTQICLDRRAASPGMNRDSASPHLRHHSEHQYALTQSLSPTSSPFHHGNAMTSLPASHKLLLSSPSHHQGSRSMEKSKEKKKKKSETLPTKVTPSKSFYGDDQAKGSRGIKGRLMNIKKKVTGKWLPRSTSMDAKELESTQRLLASRNHSFSGEADRVTPESPLPRQRYQSTSHGSNLTLVSKIFSVLDYWQEEYFEDFEVDVDLRQMLEEFLRQLVYKNYSEEVELAQQLLDLLEKKMEDAVPPDSSFPALLSRVTDCNPQLLDLFDWEDRDKLMVGRRIDLSKSVPKDSPFLKTLAEQLTLMEFSIYAAIQRRELLNCNWKSRDKEKLAPNVSRLIRRTNEMTSWVCTEILTRDTPAARATVIEHFVQIALHCYKHNDMHCALNITVALASSSIKGLSKTWEEVDKKYRHKFEKLKELTDYHGRCKKMRARLDQITAEMLQKNQQPRALPYIGAYLDQIYSLEMNVKTWNTDGLVNFAKMTKLAELVKTALQYQNSYFKFEPRLDVIAYLTAAERLSENEIYELSIRRD